MEKIIILIYESLGRVMSVVAQLPYIVEIDSRIITWGFTILIFLTAILLLIAGTGGPKGVHVPIRGGMGMLHAGAIAISGALVESGKSIEQSAPVYVILAFGILLLVMLLVLAENMIVGKGNGIRTICLWLGEWFMAALAMRVWYMNKTEAGRAVYQNLFPSAKLEAKYEAFMMAHSFDYLITYGKWLIVVVCLSVGVILMAKAKTVIGGDYPLISMTLMSAVFVYMVFLSHEGSSWKIQSNFLAYALMAGAQLQFVFLMFYVPVNKLIHMNKEKEKVPKVLMSAFVAMAEALIAGFLWSVSGSLCVSLAKDGAMNVIVEPVSKAMSWFYKRLPAMKYAYNTNFLHPSDRVYLGMSVSVLLTIGLTILLFLILKLILGGLDYAGLTITWLRNSILVFTIPVVLYWFTDMSADQLGNAADWLPVLFRSVSCLGLLMCLSNFIPAIRKKGAFSLVKWTIVGLIVSLLFSSLLIPVLMIFA